MKHFNLTEEELLKFGLECVNWRKHITKTEYSDMPALDASKLAVKRLIKKLIPQSEKNMPLYIEIEASNQKVKFSLSPKREFLTDLWQHKFKLKDNEFFYVTVFGWGLIINENLEISEINNNPLFQNKKVKIITEEEYNNGVFEQIK